MGWLHWATVYLAAEWTLRLAMLFYVPQKRTPAAARAWLLLIFLQPVIGLALYLAVGRIRVSGERISRQERSTERIRAEIAALEAREPWARSGAPAGLEETARLAETLGDFPIFGGNSVEVMTGYDGSIDRLVADIDAARDHAHLLYYIFEADGVGRRVAGALERAVKRGVACRVIMDAMGSERGLKELAPGMRAAGIEVLAALEVGFWRKAASRADLRNHRKIAVIDGRVGYSGSQNIVGGVFIPGVPNEEMVVRVTGPVVAQLQVVFLSDRYTKTGVAMEEPGLFPELERTGATAAQVLPSGPEYRRQNQQELMVTWLYTARKRAVITTPYFVPDEIFVEAMTSAAHRGVEVHLVVSRHNNHRVTQLAEESFYEALLGAGVKIHRFRPRFLHAKSLTIDGAAAIIGSTNIDIRSFALNEEVSLLIYDPAVVSGLEAWHAGLFADSETPTVEEWAARAWGQRLMQNLARLVDSLL